MPKIKPEIWTKHDGKQFVMLSLEDFERLQEMVEDAGLLRLLREARRRNAGKPTYTLAQVRERLGLTPPRKRKAK